MNKYKIRIIESGIKSGYFIGEELMVDKSLLDMIKVNNIVDVLEEPVKKSTTINKIKSK